MNSIDRLEELIESSELLPVMFLSTTYLTDKNIDESSQIKIDLEWDVSRIIEVEDYGTKEFFISTPYFRPITKYNLLDE